MKDLSMFDRPCSLDVCDHQDGKDWFTYCGLSEEDLQPVLV